MPARQETRRRFLRKAVMAGGLLALGADNHAPATAAPVPTTPAKASESTQTESAEKQSFLNPFYVRAKLDELERQYPEQYPDRTNRDQRIQEAIKWLDSEFDKAGGKLGIHSPTSGFTLPPGQWLYWTNPYSQGIDKGQFPTSSSILSIVEHENNFFNWGPSLHRAVVPAGEVHVPTPGRAIRLSDKSVAYDLRFSPEEELKRIHKEIPGDGLDTQLARVHKAVDRFDDLFRSTFDNVLRESVGKTFGPNGGTLETGEWLIYMLLNRPVTPHLRNIDWKFGDVPGFVVKGSGEWYGFFRASVMDQNIPMHIPSAGRAIKIGTSLTDQRFVPVVNQQ